MTRTQFSLFGVAVAAAISALPAAAQTEAKPWQGGHLGYSFGVGLQSGDNDEDVQFDTNLDNVYGDTVRTAAGANAFAPGFCGGAANGRTPGEGCRGDRDRADFFIRGGYDIQNGNLVYGVVVDAGTGNSTDSVTAFSVTPAFYTFTRKLDFAAGLRGRVGYATGGVLAYATGGLAYGRIENSQLTSNGANTFNGNVFFDRQKTSSWGYSAGAGVETKVEKNISVGLEYLYTSYRGDDYVVRVGPGTAPATNPFRIVNPNGTNMRRGDRNFDLHNIRLTASYRF